MRGEKSQLPNYTVATIINADGVPKYHVLPGRLVTILIISVTLLFTLVVMLGFLMLKNKFEIENLKQQVSVEETEKEGTK